MIPSFPVFILCNIYHPPADFSSLGEPALAHALSAVIQRVQIESKAAMPAFTTTGIRDIVNIDKYAG